MKKPLPSATSSRRYNVYADLRWPAKTGIGNVMAACIERAPANVNLVALKIGSGIGSVWSPFSVARSLKNQTEDGVFWSAGFVPPSSSKYSSVVTVHDLTHRHYYSPVHRTYYDLVFRRMYRNCTSIICGSDFSRTEFLEWSGMARDRVHVIPHGIDEAFAENNIPFVADAPYILYPGNRRKYKNLDRLMTAYARSSLPAKGIFLMLTGDPDPAIKERAHSLGISWRLRFSGRVSDDEMPKLYRGAMLVAFVSLYEGFGMPIVEAMASRTPVMTSNVTAMPEVAGGAALIVDPFSVAEITTALDRLAQDSVLREELIGRGVERATHFRWNIAASALWAIIDQASTNDRRRA
ncbi:glycosyltransferase family 4 protein [Caballeronia sp. LjRoot31]|uniref:glycosyltransferase family 4 protein n=1 Tax=Caballeronia sp. LjRoot31 TaxID=3342324 RepID=UPI003ECD94E0